MNLKITSSVNLNIGGSAVSNIVGDIVAYTDLLLSTGVVNCDLKWWLNTAAKNANLDLIYPLVSGRKVASCSVTLTEQEATAANLPNTIYTKVAAKLALDYTWTVVVE